MSTPTDAVRLWTELYRGQRGWLEIRTLRPRSQAWFRTDELQAAWEHCERQDRRGAEVYFGVHLRTSDGGAGNADVERCGCLVADLDHYKGEAARLDQAVAAGQLPQPSAVVGSGGGRHAYWLLDSPVTPAEATQRSSSISVLLAADDISDPARILRVPGTHNHKQATPRAVVLRSVGGLRYNLSDFKDLPAPRRVGGSRQAGGITPDDEALAELLDQAGVTVRRVKPQGVEVDCPVCSDDAPPDDQVGKGFIFTDGLSLYCQRGTCPAHQGVSYEGWALDLSFELPTPRAAPEPPATTLTELVYQELRVHSGSPPRRGWHDVTRTKVNLGGTRTVEGQIVEPGQEYSQQERVHRPTPGVLRVLQTPAGAGKTRAALEALRLVKAERRLLVAPTDALVEELESRAVSQHGYRAIRRHVGLSYAPGGKPVCVQPEQVKRAARNGWSPRQMVCLGCPEKATCVAYRGYVDRVEGAEPELELATHAALLKRILPSGRLGVKTALVVDELPPLLEGEGYSRERLHRALAVQPPGRRRLVEKVLSQLDALGQPEHPTAKVLDSWTETWEAEVVADPDELNTEPVCAAMSAGKLVVRAKGSHAEAWCPERLGDRWWNGTGAERQGFRCLVLDASADRSSTMLTESVKDHCATVVHWGKDNGVGERRTWRQTNITRKHLSKWAYQKSKQSSVVRSTPEEMVWLLKKYGIPPFITWRVHSNYRKVELAGHTCSTWYPPVHWGLARQVWRAAVEGVLLHGQVPDHMCMVSFKPVVDSLRKEWEGQETGQPFICTYHTAVTLRELGVKRLTLFHWGHTRGLDGAADATLGVFLGDPRVPPSEVEVQAQLLGVDERAARNHLEATEWVQALGRLRSFRRKGPVTFHVVSRQVPTPWQAGTFEALPQERERFLLRLEGKNSA